MSKFDELRDKIEKQGKSKDVATKIAAAIGRKKYGNEGMAKKAAAARKANASEQAAQACRRLRKQMFPKY